ncbi:MULTISPECIES: Holliday junction resolvase RuvX [unclassified Massilia]|uniref:Holliday junction resolvase RuvX n=1 Tax=unclassified Massilia TaxID=2609279 RepID=UPI001B828E05|nr:MULTISPECIES: Holliday junction resolvase RuvX [unclassified Massilia]MBQ5940313.1 Holliday junction resolvase RuvX [Massilia sp. AB1]MBQ5963487.1 Holliday junction resolvase RuvX [Massilia sp. ZL223]
MVDIVFGFDFGVKRIGIAMGNTLTGQAQPLTVIKAVDNATRFQVIGDLIEQWRPARLVVGEPRHPDGAEHEMTARSRRFANQLHGRFNLPVDLVDERYSSAVIQAKRGEVIDAKAAAIILQQYFDDHANI